MGQIYRVIYFSREQEPGEEAKEIMQEEMPSEIRHGRNTPLQAELQNALT